MTSVMKNRRQKPMFLEMGDQVVKTLYAKSGGIAARVLYAMGGTSGGGKRYSWQFGEWNNHGARGDIACGTVTVKQADGEVTLPLVLKCGGDPEGLILADVKRPTFSVRETTPYTIQIGNGAGNLVREIVHHIMETWVIQGSRWLEITRTAHERRREKRRRPRHRDWC